MLDGQSSLDDIAERFEREFPAANDPHRGAAAVHRHAPPQRPGDHRRRRARASSWSNAATSKRKKQRLATLTNILSIRFKGIDPERFFNFIYPYIRWFFTVPAMVVLHHAGAVRR